MRKDLVHKIVPACVGLPLAAAIAGCLRPVSQLGQQTMAFSSAAIVVTGSSEDAYASANRLHSNEQMALAVIAYDKSPSWSPETYVRPLLSEDQLEARREVLDGLKTYAETLGTLTSARGDTDLNAAAKEVGTSLQQLSSTVNTSFGTGTGFSITDTEKNVLSTALVALGTYLQQRTVSKQLPAVLQANDKAIGDLCDVLLADIKILRRQASKDYGELEIAQDQYIRTAQPPFAAEQRRIEIAKLPAMVLHQQQNDRLLAKLDEAIHTLKVTHHALAAAASSDSPATVRQFIAELVAEGQSLASYYSSLSGT